MNTALKFAGITPCPGIQSPITTRLTPRPLSFIGTCTFDSDKIRIQHHHVGSKRKTQLRFWDNHRISARASNSDFDVLPVSLSPSQKVKQFYACINDKNLQQLGEGISNDAQFDDYSFIKPFTGKREVMNFLNKLIASMGQNVKFNVGHICEGDGYTATANWHMEWKNARIPFTRGCTFFEFTKEGEKLTIKNAVVLIESPIKPGSIVLTLLKTVTSLFDDFPRATEWFLRSPHAVLKRITQIYNILIAPIIVNPLLACYITCWSFGARVFGYIYKIAIFIYRIFFPSK